MLSYKRSGGCNYYIALILRRLIPYIITAPLESEK